MLPPVGASLTLDQDSNCHTCCNTLQHTLQGVLPQVGVSLTLDQDFDAWVEAADIARTGGRGGEYARKVEIVCLCVGVCLCLCVCVCVCVTRTGGE